MWGQARLEFVLAQHLVAAMVADVAGVTPYRGAFLAFGARTLAMILGAAVSGSHCGMGGGLGLGRAWAFGGASGQRKNEEDGVHGVLPWGPPVGFGAHLLSR